MSARDPWWLRWLHCLAFLPEPSRRVGLTGRRTLLLARRVFLALLLLPTLSAGFAAPAAAQSPSTVPMVSITGGPTVTEGADATFTLTASPAPSADITVNVNVADSGSFAVHGQTGPRAVTVGMDGTGSLTVATVNDGVDDWSGAITATVQAGDGYRVSSPSSASVAVLNDGVQLPDLTVYLAQDPNLDLSKITEGNEIFFEVVPSWPTSHPLPVALKTTQTGDFIAEKFLYAYLHEMDSIANWVFYVLIDNDDIDEPDGSVTAISEYGNGRTSNSVTVPIIDDDPTVVSLARAGSGAVGTGGKVAFTVTLGRALVAGETIDVPLAISGAGVSVNGYTLSVTGGTGATLWGTGVLTPVLRFSGAGAQAATLELVPAVGSTAGQYTIALGPDGTGANGFDRAGLGTNVGGGADPSTTQNGFDVQVASATQATELVTPQATEPVTPRVNLSSGAGGTEGETVEFTLVVTPPPPPLEVTLMVGQNGDYVGNAALGRRTVTVPTSGSVTVTVPTVDDGADEPDGTVTATLEAGSGYTLGALGTLAVDVADNDGLPRLSFAEQRVDVVEGATTDAVLTVNLNEKSYKPVTFDYTLSGKATAGEDYESPQSRSVSIPPGSTSADLVFKIKDDPRHESLEPIIVTLIDPVNALAPEPGNMAVVLIASDDGPPVLSVEASSVQEPPPGYARYMPFALTLAPASGYEVVVDVADTMTGTATSASSCPGNCVGTRDYVTGRSRVRFAPGETYKVVNFGVRGDAVDEEDETIIVRLSAASRQVTFADGTLSGTRWFQEVAGTIEDDDERGIEVTPATLTLAEPDGAGSYEVSLTSKPTHVVAIDLSSSDPAVATVSPARLTFTPGSWDKPQAVTVTAADDDNAGGARTATISHAVTAGTSDYGAVTVPDVTVTVSGGEAAPSVVSTQVAEPVTVSLSAEQSAIAEANGKTKFRIALSRTLRDGEVVKVPFTITGGKWKRDWHVKFQDAHNGPGVERTRSGRKSAVRFTKGGRVATLVLVARPNEDTEARTISISFGTGKRAPRSTGVAGGLALVDKPIAVAIIDDDWGMPAVTVAAGGAVTEGGDATFTLRADPAPIGDLAVTVGVTQTGTVADTVTLGPRTVTIPAGAMEGAFTVATTDDSIDGPGGAVTATVVKKAGYTLGETPAATVAVADDDTTGVTLSAPSGDVTEAGGRKVLTVALARTLAAGERLTVPLLFGGTADLGSDYTLAAPETTPTGVTYANLTGSGAPALTFTGPSAASATVLLTTTADTAAEGASETVTVALGTLAATGLDGGAQGSGTVGFAILEPPPEIAIVAKTASVVEGGDAGFTVTASRAPGSDLTVHLAVAEAGTGDFVAAETEGAATVMIPKGETDAAVTVPTVNDAADEPDGTVTVTLAEDGQEGLRYTVAASPGDAATVTVTDDDAAVTGPALSIADATAQESERLIRFTVRLSPSVDHPVTVSYHPRDSRPVSARQGQDYVALGTSIRFKPFQTKQEIMIYVFDDNHNEDPETFELVLSHPDGAMIADGVAVGTIVNSDPMPAAWLSRFGRTVAQQALDGIAGRLAAARTPGASGTLAGQAFAFAPGSPAGTGASGGTGTPNASGVGVRASSTASGLPGSGLLAPAGLARAFGAMNAPGPLSGFGIGTPGSGLDQTVSDRAPGFGNGGFGNDQGYAQPLTVQDVLLGSSFTVTGKPDGTGGSLAFWGRAAQARFDGREGRFGLDGEATTALLGADYARGRWLVGLALTQSTGPGGYTDLDPGTEACPPDMDEETRSLVCDGAVREGAGTVDASLTAAVPYAAFQATERLRLWGAGGYGTGEVTLTPTLGGVLKADLDWTMAATGMQGDLLPPPAQGTGPALAVISDALWARTTSEQTAELAASDSAVTRLRLGLRGSWRLALDEDAGPGTGASLTPKLEVGARHDGGDAETGFGVELGGGVVWVDPALGLSLDLTGRTLLTHQDQDFADQGVAAAFSFDPAPATPRGPSLTLRQDWGGRAQGGLEALFAPAPLTTRPGSAQPSRWALEAAYGVPVFGGRFTGSPQVGLGFAGTARTYTVGWRLTPEAASPLAISFGLQAGRRESATAQPEHTVGVEVQARW